MNRTLLALVAMLLLTGVAAASDPVYRKANEYPLIDEMVAARKSHQAALDSIQAAIDTRYTDQAEAEEKLSLRPDWSKVQRPSGPEAFDTIWHNPPVPQYLTGTCWAFCSVSFIESEVKRLHDREVKLSEMFIVYWEYVEKARRFVREQGHSVVSQGSQDHGTTETMRLYGAVPQSAYAGVLATDGRYDHGPLMDELKGYLDWMKASGTWNEDIAIANVRRILDRHMGPVPERFDYAGQTWTPMTFRDEYLGIDVDDYVNVVSTMRHPFSTYVTLDVHDNWRRKGDYLNLPLDEFYAVLKGAVEDGYSVSIGGDNSEPGLDGKYDAAIIPNWDIPADAIDQGAREFRIENGTTTDDHGIHVVGLTRIDGRDWFLIKDSNRSSRLGEHKGYYFFDGDYIRLKMLSFMVHRDRLTGRMP